MSLEQIWQQFVANIKETRWQEWVSTTTQVASVWYARKNNVLVYPTGIIGVILAAYVYFFQTHPPLYADASLNIYYFIMSVYGWYNWVQKKDAEHYTYPIKWCSKSELVFGIGFFLFFWIIIYLVLVKFTNSNTPVLDSLVSASAVTAMWWMAKRKIENWIVWIIADMLYVGMYIYKHLYFTSILYFIFIILAIAGYREWKKVLVTK